MKISSKKFSESTDHIFLDLASTTTDSPFSKEIRKTFATSNPPTTGQYMSQVYYLNSKTKTSPTPVVIYCFSGLYSARIGDNIKYAFKTIQGQVRNKTIGLYRDFGIPSQSLKDNRFETLVRAFESIELEFNCTFVMYSDK